MKNRPDPLFSEDSSRSGDEETFDESPSSSPHFRRPDDGGQEEVRDEVQEVQKLASKDTRRLHLWRVVVTLVLLATAIVVTFTTYSFLKQEQSDNFHEAVRECICSFLVRQVRSSSHSAFCFGNSNA